MYVNAETILSAAALLGAVGAILGGLFAAYSWYQKQNKQDEDIKAMKEEMCLLTYGVLACLKGLKEMGRNGSVTEAIDKIEKHMNQEAHK
ncbi:branched-chain amino acid ABC transporter permease [Clostridiaceae bacterium]|nr:branched-chain amino acid ABC transporter permease [Clostridiaceae bacterium]RKI12087.1 branched-chain amino acid ABC transporter permease [bacterium 1XD21-70]